MTPFAIFGAGGHAKVVADAARVAGIHISFMVDDHPTANDLLGVRLLSSRDGEWMALDCFEFVVAIGKNEARMACFEKIRSRNGTPKSVVHPFSSISRDAYVDAGTVVFAGAIINPGSTVGPNCIINTAASVDHDCTIGAHTHLCPGVRLAGGVSIGSQTMIGIGASVLPGISIGHRCTIGAGALVNKNVSDGAVVYGVPARSKEKLKTQS